MAVQTNTSHMSLENMAEASSLLEYMRNAPTGENQDPNDTLKEVTIGTAEDKINFSQGLSYVFEYAQVIKWLEQYLELRDYNEAQPLTTRFAVWSNDHRTIGDYRQRQRISWRRHITTAKKQEEVIAILRLFGLDAIADRLGYLHRIALDDPDEESMALESLRELALFLMSERQLPDPRIAISPEGFAQIEWRVAESGILAMEFLPENGLIRFAAVSAPAKRGVQRMRVYGTLPKDDALNAVKMFTSGILTQ